MIRPPYPSEVFARHNTHLNSYSHWLNHYIGRYRWSASVLHVGNWKDQTTAALQEFFPDAAVVALTKWNDLDLFVPEHANRFSVVLISVSSHHRNAVVGQLKRTVRDGGLLVAEGEAADCRTETVGGITVSYWLNIED